MSRYLVNVSHLCYAVVLCSFSPERWLSLTFLHPQHLLTFSLQDGDVQGVEEAQARLSFLAQNKKLWSQQMFLDVGAEAIKLRDIQSLVRTHTWWWTGALCPELCVISWNVRFAFSSRTSWRATPTNPSTAAMLLTQKSTSLRSFCWSARAHSRRSPTSIFLAVRRWRWLAAVGSAGGLFWARVGVCKWRIF